MQGKQIDQPFITGRQRTVYIREIARLGVACGKLQAENDRLLRAVEMARNSLELVNGPFTDKARDEALCILREAVVKGQQL